MQYSAEAEARKALNRLRRAAEKAELELGVLEGVLKHAEGIDFPVQSYEGVAAVVRALLEFTEDEGSRLQEKILRAGGLEPGRVRRS